jgi:hypothetical protein
MPTVKKNTDAYVPEVEFARVVNELLEAGCPPEFIASLRKFHGDVIACADLLLGALQWPGGKEHFMADDAFENLEDTARKLREEARDLMLARARS